jgi:ABC-type oligopeptide transport system ATPase subunit
LFAKAIEGKVPFIICDDIVNAIDFDFRRNILNFLLNYPQISEVQVILSTHSENFKNTVKENL